MDFSDLNKALVTKRDLRDEAIKDVNQAIRNCGRAILAAHHNRLEEARGLLKEAEEIWRKYKVLIPEHPRLYGYIINLEQELVEARAYIFYREKGDFYSWEGDVYPEAYALGMADLIGELRRLAIELARLGNIAKAMRVLEDSERLYLSLREIDYTAVKELRHKLDVYRRSLATLKEELTLIKRLKIGSAGSPQTSQD